MRYLFSFLIFLFFFSCTKDDEAGTKYDNDYTYDPSSRDSIATEKYDKYFEYQWYLEHEQFYSINVIAAWEITKGAGVKVAVLDDGIQKSHEDFENIEVYNVRNRSNSCEPSDRKYYSHGTAAAGVLAARQNEVGTMGVAPECGFLFIGDDSPNIYSDARAISAFEYAKNWGAKVISCSWGSYNVSPTLESQIEQLYNSGIVVVFACGNDNDNLDLNIGTDESELPWVIGVSASGENGNRASYSNYGSNIDIMAPGNSIFTLDLMGADGSNSDIDQNYTYVNGTSFSAPIVAGVAALILSVDPLLTPSEVRDIIIKTAQKTGSAYDGNGFSLYHAYGLIDAGEAVRRAAGLFGSTAISQ